MKVTIGKATLYLDDCATVLADLPSASLDSAVVDPPYGLSFMGNKWDHDVPKAEVWGLVMSALKPGAHLLSFFGSRTYHRGAVQIEDAGFEIRDQIMWIYGSGFPKSLNVAKAIDATLIHGGSHSTHIRKANESREGEGRSGASLPRNGIKADDRKANVTNDNPTTAEAAQWQGWGTALKPAHEPIVVARKPLTGTVATNVLQHGTGALNIDACRIEEAGRWPANVIHDGLTEDWSRFFYCAKASKKDRGEGNTHPTVKPTPLMAYLCRLVTPPGGTVLDPYLGSGSTGVAAVAEGFNFIGIERDADSFAIACDRLRKAQGL